MKLARNLFIMCAAVALILVSVHMCVADNFNMHVVEQNGVAKLMLTYNQKQYEVVLTPVGQTTPQTVQTAPQTPQTTQTTPQTGTQQAAITLEEAKSIALKDAGLTTADFVKTKQDYDDGRLVYEIDFRGNDKEYEYDIEASTGRILKTDVEPYFSPVNNNAQQNTQQTAVTAAEAEEIALKDAGFTKANVTYIHTHNDRDDGRVEYDVEFLANGAKYEYTIGADDGKIYDKDIDRD